MIVVASGIFVVIMIITVIMITIIIIIIIVVITVIVVVFVTRFVIAGVPVIHILTNPFAAIIVTRVSRRLHVAKLCPILMCVRCVVLSRIGTLHGYECMCHIRACVICRQSKLVAERHVGIHGSTQR